MRRTVLAIVLLATALPLFAATESNPSPKQRALIVKLLETMDVGKAGSSLMDAVFAQIQKQFIDAAKAKGNRPEDIAEAEEVFSAFRQKAAKIDVAGLMQDEYIRIYAKYFTEKELEDLLAFYSTPTGKKAIAVMSDVAREGMEGGVRLVSPKIEQVMAESMEEQEKKHPWRRTKSDIESVATALVAYSTDNDDLFPEGDYASLASVLEDYVDKFPQKDIWGNAYAYVVSPDRKHFRLVSAGADSIFDWDSRRISTTDTKMRYRDRLEDDFIYADDQFVQLPVQTKPRD
jgi:hypothetical protein